MIVNNIKDLKKIVKLCQDLGVASIKIDGIEMTLVSKPKAILRDVDAFPEASIRIPTYSPIQVQDTANSVIERVEMPDELTDEQALYYSAKAEPQ